MKSILMIVLSACYFSTTGFAQTIPCKSGLKSNTYQLELDKTICRDWCPNEICHGPAIMNTTIFANQDKYQIDCQCLGNNPGGGGGNSDSCHANCKIQYGGRFPQTVNEAIGPAPQRDLRSLCQEFCDGSSDALSCTVSNIECR